MVIVDELNLIGISYEIRKSVTKHSTVITDGYMAFARLNEVVDNHIQMVVPSQEAHKKFRGYILLLPMLKDYFWAYIIQSENTIYRIT